MLRLANQGRKINAAELAGSKSLRFFRAIDRTVSPIATTATMQAIGAPRGQEAAQAVGGAVMGGGTKLASLPFAKLLEPSRLGDLPKESRVFKAIMRPENFEDLPKYVQNQYHKNAPEVIIRNERGENVITKQPYPDYRQKMIELRHLDEKARPLIRDVVEGNVDDKVITAFRDSLAADPQAQDFFDYISIVSDPAKGLNATGRYRKMRVLDALVQAGEYHLTKKQADIQAGGAASSDAHMQLLKIMNKKTKDAVNSIPSEVLNGSHENFMKHIEGMKERSGLEYMSKEISDILEMMKKDNPYQFFAADFLKLYAPVMDSTNPSSLRELLGYIANAPEIAERFETISKKAADPGRVNLFTEQEVPRLDPKASARNLEMNPDAIKEVIRLSQDTVGTFHEYGAALRDAQTGGQQLKLSQRLYDEKLRAMRIQTSLDASFLQAEFTHAANQAERHARRAGDGWLDEKGRTHTGWARKLRDEGMKAKPTETKVALKLSEDLMKSRRLNPDEVNALPENLRAFAQRGDNEIQLAQLAVERARAATVAQATLDQRLADTESLRQDAVTRDMFTAASRGEGEVMRLIFNNLPENMNSVEVKGSRYFQNVIYLISKDVAESASNGDGFTINPTHIGMLRLLENPSWQRRLMGSSLDPKVAGRMATEIRNVTDTLHGISAETERWRTAVNTLNQLFDRKREDLPALARQISYMRDAFKISKISREIQKRSSELYALADKIGEGSKLSLKDKKQLLWFAKSGMVERMRMAKEPDWIITYQGEVNTIFRTLKETVPAIQERAVELVSRATGVDPKSLDGAVISSWFIHPKTNYDGSGNVRTALTLAQYWHDVESGVWSAGGAGESVRKFGNQEILATVMSRDTALSIEKDVGLLAASKALAKAKGSRFFSRYAKEIEALKYRGKSFQHFQNRDGFVSIVKRVQGGVVGFTKNHYLVVDGKVTPNGELVLNWAKGGFSSDVLDVLIEKHRQTITPPQAKPEQLRVIQEQMAELRKDIVTYLPKPGVSAEGILKDVTADDYGMAYEFLKVHQKWDRLKVEERNKLNAQENARLGTRMNDIEYFPHRIDSGSQLLVEVTLDPTQLDSPTLYSQLFGRMINSSIEGQVAKAQAVASEVTLRHPMENFHLDTQSLFQAVLTREPLRRLHDSAKMLQLAGYENCSRAVLGHFMAADVDSKANRSGSFLKGLNALLDRGLVVKELRALGVYLDPTIRLSLPVKTLLENPVQTGLMSLASNPAVSLREFTAMARFYPEFARGAFMRIREAMFKGESVNEADVKLVTRVFNPLTSEYHKELSLVSQSLNPERTPHATQALKRINWEVSPALKKADIVAGDKAAALYAELGGISKENSEKIVLDVRLDTAGSLWKSVTEDLIEMRQKGASREEMIRHADQTLYNEFRGALANKTLAYNFAVEATDGVLAGKPLAGLRGFAVNYANTHIGRFDPDNLPAFIKSYTRWRPGAAQFFNPTFNGLYRLGAAVHAVHGRRGASAADTAMAAASVAAIMGATGAAVYTGYAVGLPWFSRMSLLPGTETAYNVVTDEGDMGLGKLGTNLANMAQQGAGSRGGGDMAMRAWINLAGLLIGQGRDWIASGEEGSIDTDTFNKATHERLVQAMELVYQAGPLAMFTETLVNVPRAGWAWYEPDALEFSEAFTKSADDGFIHPDYPGVMAPEEKGITVDILRRVASGVAAIYPLRDVRDIDPEYLGAVLGQMGVNVPAETLAKMVATLRKRREVEEMRGPATAQGIFPLKPAK
jgi:hypothetical protein